MPCCLQEDDCAVVNQQLAMLSEELANTKAELHKAAATNAKLSSGLEIAASKFENAQKACGVASPHRSLGCCVEQTAWSAGLQSCSCTPISKDQLLKPCPAVAAEKARV